jgi:hypothetical protein
MSSTTDRNRLVKPLRTAVESLHQPQYTGENRCTPCTVVNVAIAGVASALVGFVWPPLAALAFGVSVGVIDLRGYLVPGAPTLTKRYLPDRVLVWFDRTPVDPQLGEGVDPDGDLDPETVLVDVGALEPCGDGTDLCLTSGFDERLSAHIERVRESEGPRLALADLLVVDQDRVELGTHRAAFVAEVGGEQISRWPSRAALVADLAADRALREQTRDLADLPIERRSGLLGSLRVFVECYPEFDGRVQFREKTVESCCRPWAVLACECEDCGARLFEAKASEVEDGG